MGFSDADLELMDRLSGGSQSAPEGGGSTGALVTDGATGGESPYTAIPESPLSLVDRAQMGWARKPEEQLKLLKSKFQDAELVPNADGGHQLAIKDKDGKWYQADPAFHWSQSAAGINVPSADNHNVKKVAGSIAQDIGEYGLRASGAMALGGQGMTYGAAIGSTAGPVGTLIGGAVGGLAGAAAGAMGAEGLDMASRKAFNPPQAAGSGVVPQNADELNKQMAASALFGMKTFAEAKAGEAVMSTAAKKLGNILGSLTDDPESQRSARKILTMMGADDRLADARLQNPYRTSMYDEMASSTPANPQVKTSIDRAEDAAFERMDGEVQSVLKRAQGQFAQLEKMPGVSDLSVDNNGLVAKTIDDLKGARLLLDNEETNPVTVLGEGDEKALKYLRGLSSRAGDMDYRDLRAEQANISNLFNNGVTHPQLRSALQQLKVGMNDSIVQNLPEDTVDAYTGLMKKYGPIKEMADDMAGLSESNRKLRFGDKILSANRNDSKELVDSMFNAGVDPDAYYNYMQVQAAKASKDWFVPGKSLKWLPKPNPEVASQALGGARNLTPAYAAKTIQFLKGLSDEQFKQVMTNPGMFDQVAGMAAGAANVEHQSTDSLMQQAGGQ